jgi:hypothetical protein
MSFVFLILFPGNLKIFAGLLFFAALIVFIIAFLFITMAGIWAPRKVILDKIPAYDAFVVGIHIAKKKFWKTLMYGGFNTLMQTIILIIVFVLPLLIIATLLFIAIGTAKTALGITITLGIIMALLFVIWIAAITILTGVVTTFKTAIWSICYQKIRGKYEH